MSNQKLKTEKEISEPDFKSKQYLIAPCGMNCGICSAFLRKKNKCSGCRATNKSRLNHCFTCLILNCEFLEKTQSKFCFDCEKYPCIKIKKMDKRYREKYGMSTIENLKTIQKHGLVHFIKSEDLKWLAKIVAF